MVSSSWIARGWVRLLLLLAAPALPSRLAPTGGHPRQKRGFRERLACHGRLPCYLPRRRMRRPGNADGCSENSPASRLTKNGASAFPVGIFPRTTRPRRALRTGTSLNFAMGISFPSVAPDGGERRRDVQQQPSPGTRASLTVYARSTPQEPWGHARPVARACGSAFGRRWACAVSLPRSLLSRDF